MNSADSPVVFTTHDRPTLVDPSPGSSSLVIVYHRQPYEEVSEHGQVYYRENSSPNGIVPSLRGFFASVDHGSWVAWRRHDGPEPPDFPRAIGLSDRYGRYDVVRLPLTGDEVHSFYHVTSKEALWPILHSFPWQFSVENADWETFRRVNKRFAEGAAEAAAPGALVWVHDYNLWLVPGYLRALRPDVRIAFFHHTPFPAPDIFNILPWRKEIVDSLLSCDLVGFHVPRYARNFAAVVRALDPQSTVDEAAAPNQLRGAPGAALSEESMPVRVWTGRRVVDLDVSPVGTSPQAIRDALAANRARVRQIRDELGGRRLILSLGRVDYTKGIIEMLDAFERLLERDPSRHRGVQLMLTTASAATGMAVYIEARERIEQLVGRINGRFSQLGWVPIMLSTQAMPFAEVVAWYRAADVCWITPLRDGLNLVAKEYVAAQGPDGDGVLVLSEFAGASVELPEAVTCNPYSQRSMDETLVRALDMPLAERRERLRSLAEQVSRYDISYWSAHLYERFAALSGASHSAALEVAESADPPQDLLSGSTGHLTATPSR